MHQYKDLIHTVLNYGTAKTDRTGVGTISVFGAQSRYDLKDGFPLLTLKKTHWKSIVIELLWLMRGETNISFLKKHGVSIWDEWADKNGDLGPVYGEQWRKWKNTTVEPVVITNEDYEEYYVGDRTNTEIVDQLTNVIERIKTNPDCRRLIVSAWNAPEIPKMKLPPCHAFFQFYVQNNQLSCQLYQRSADLFLGVPFNIASYALLTHLIANETGLSVGDFIHTFGDLHLYNNHIDQAKEVLQRENLILPNVTINLKQGELMEFIDNCHDLTWDEIKKVIVLEGYNSHPAIKAEVAV